MIEILITTLKKIREDAKNEFHILYENVEVISIGCNFLKYKYSINLI